MSTWLIGAGYMAQEYAKVLNILSSEYVVIGRGKKSAIEFESLTNHSVRQGGLTKALKELSPPIQAIVAVGVEDLSKIASELVRSGVKRILLEKPGGINKQEISKLNVLAKSYNSNILIAYNRRFYASTEALKELVKIDGGATSCIFEFTEWSHKIEPLIKGPGVKESWFLTNSSHIADLAFHICGHPKEFSAWHGGSLSWHKASERFSGSGITEKNILFSYHADWSAPGRWGVEVLTRKNRYILKPLEKLQVVRSGSVIIENIEIDDENDMKYKPGIYNQIKAFLEAEDAMFCLIEEQLKHIDIYNKIAGYD
ncbi:gfo/Idh/MocA family oxidoreductase [Candidatus Pseudothioglobus singularis]|jgi:predicted dehydrogenase|nr:gfo/Idh/MocA family oxidoreductase [Candidatus Pseudothioglobus singularis]